MCALSLLHQSYAKTSTTTNIGALINMCVNTNVDYLFFFDETLKQTYEVYQNKLSSIKHKDIEYFKAFLEQEDTHYIYSNIKNTNKPCFLIQYEYSNGSIEGTNSLIKVIKKIAFGYRSIFNFKI